MGGNPRPFGIRDPNGRGIAIRAAAHNVFRGESSFNGRGIAIRAAARNIFRGKSSFNGRGIAIRAAAHNAFGGFTLVELLTVLAILVIVAAVAIPSLISLFSGNNLVQARNQVSSDLAYARNLALQMHTDVALVFYEEESTNEGSTGYLPSNTPVHSGSTAVAFAMALPGQPANTTGPIYFEPYSGAATQYLPHGIYAAALTGIGGTINNGFALPPTAGGTVAPRAIVFDPDGHLIIVNELAAAANPSDPTADYGDWNFSPTGGSPYGPSSGAFVVYEPSTLPNPLPGGQTIGQYLAANADVQTVNSYTGSVVP